jgi:hypothetical protein
MEFNFIGFYLFKGGRFVGNCPARLSLTLVAGQPPVPWGVHPIPGAKVA